MGHSGRLEVLAVSGASAVAIALVTAVLGFGVPTSIFGYCRPMGLVSENGTIYRSCEVGLDWTNVWYTPKEIAQTFYQGILFNLAGYNTYGSPVVTVAGHEYTGLTYSFLIYTCPTACNQTNFTVLSEDRLFGAVWDGGPTMTLLVRAT
jgi:hypothetical protein